jgi:hypothetical protein
MRISCKWCMSWNTKKSYKTKRRTFPLKGRTISVSDWVKWWKCQYADPNFTPSIFHHHWPKHNFMLMCVFRH